MLRLGPIRRGWEPPWVLRSLPHYDSWLAGRRGKFKSALIQTLRKWNRGSRVEKENTVRVNVEGCSELVERRKRLSVAWASDIFTRNSVWQDFCILAFFRIFVQYILFNESLVPSTVNTTLTCNSRAANGGELNLLFRDWAWGVTRLDHKSMLDEDCVLDPSISNCSRDS